MKVWTQRTLTWFAVPMGFTPVNVEVAHKLSLVNSPGPSFNRARCLELVIRPCPRSQRALPQGHRTRHVRHSHDYLSHFFQPHLTQAFRRKQVKKAYSSNAQTVLFFGKPRLASITDQYHTRSLIDFRSLWPDSRPMPAQCPDTPSSHSYKS